MSTVEQQFRPRTKLARIGKSRESMVERMREIESRLLVLPVHELEARVAALRRDPSAPAVDDELTVAILHERAELESELAELTVNIAAADVVIGEHQAEVEAEARATAIAEAERLLALEEELWAKKIVPAWLQLRGLYVQYAEHLLAVGRTRPSGYLEGVPAVHVSPSPVTFVAFLSMLVAAGEPETFEARVVDSGEVLRGMVSPFVDPRPELSGLFNVRREPVNSR